jgi:transposase
MDELTEGLDPAAAAVVKVVYTAFRQLEKYLEQIQAENAELKRILFGKSSERWVMPSAQREAAKKARAEESEEQKAERKAATQRKRKAKKARRKELPLVEERIEVPQEQLVCEQCEGVFRDLGEGLVTEQIEHIPARLVRRRIVRQKKVCRCGETIVIAPLPAQVTDGAEYGPGLHAHVVVQKCADSMPLYRQAKQLARAGAPVSRSTLGDLFHRSAEVLAPLHARLLEIIAESPHVSADETPLPVQAEGKCHRGYVWTFVADKVVGYCYSATRSGEMPLKILGESEGKLQVDGYTGYNAVTTPEGRKRAGCWAHTRRYFFKALQTAKEAGEMMDLLGELYAVEWQAQEKGICGTDAHRLLRQEVSGEVVEKIEAWLDEHEPVTPPKSPLGKAIAYTRGQWESLKVFLDDPKVAIDNNVSERALRIVALGRKNFLFAGNDTAAENLAVLQTLVATCERNGVNPQAYLTDVLVRTRDHPQSRLDELLPQNWQPPASAATS